MYYENDSSTRGRHQIHAARPFESNKVECAERAISKLTHAPTRKPGLAHTPCAEFIVIGVLIVEESEQKKSQAGVLLSFRHATVGVSLFLPRSVVTPRCGVSLPQSLEFRPSGKHPCKMSTATLPLLLPASVLGVKSESDPQEWKPSRYLQPPQPPPTDDSKQHDLEMAAARQLIDGKAFKKVRPRRTVDYFAGVGRWTLVSPHISRWGRNLTGP